MIHFTEAKDPYLAMQWQGKIEVRIFDEYSCSNFPKEGCGVGATADQRFTNDYLMRAILAKSYLWTVSEKSALVLIAIAFTSPIWLLLGGWIAKQKQTQLVVSPGMSTCSKGSCQTLACSNKLKKIKIRTNASNAKNKINAMPAKNTAFT